jgi:hypothetical protein
VGRAARATLSPERHLAIDLQHAVMGVIAFGLGARPVLASTARAETVP